MAHQEEHGLHTGGIKINRTLVLSVMLAGAFVAILNETLLNVALPPIMHHFHIDANTAQWLTTAYLLTNGVLIPVSAFLVQKFSTRSLFLVGMGLFAIGTLIAGITPNFPLLLVARVVQASGTAIILPLMMNVILAVFPVEERGAAMGMMGLVITFAPAIGPTLSGWIVGHHSWRVLFFIVLPIALLDMLFAYKSLSNVMELTNPRVDVLSVVLSTFGFGGLLYGFSAAGSNGWVSADVWVSLVVAAVSLGWFVRRQFRLSVPMLEFRVFRYGMFTLSTVITVIVFMNMFSSMLLLPLYLQNARGFSPLASGLLVLPGAIVMGIMSPITGRIFDKIGSRILAIIGSTLLSATMLFFSFLTDHTPYSTLVVAFALMMLGMSLIMMPVMTAGLNQLPQRLNPHGTAMSNTLQQAAGAIGTALLVTVMSGGTNAALAMLKGAAGVALGAKPTTKMVTLASIHGIDVAFMVSAGIAIFGLVLCLFIQRTSPAVDREEIEPDEEAQSQKYV